MRQRSATRERGVALLAFVAVIGIVATWFLVKQLNLESGGLEAARKNRNAEVLNRAKLALIGYIAAQAAKPGENRPGALPCPEAPGNFDSAANEGTVSYPCTPPTVGRFPWKTLGLDKLVDASGEPLWYVVAPGWAGANTVINSNCATYNIAGFACSTGRLTVDGVTDDVIALIIAPGPAFIVAGSGANCAAKSQTRPTSGNPDWSNYLECENATYPTADGTFATIGPSASFNDQVVKITATELTPMIEAAIAHRIEREIAPDLKTMYNGWLPYAADFVYPTTTLTLQGVPPPFPKREGLLPLAYAETAPESRQRCAPGVAAPRCIPDIGNLSGVVVTSGGTYTPTCTVSNDATTTAATISCAFNYRCLLGLCATPSTVAFSMNVTAAKVGTAIRPFNPSYLATTNISGGVISSFNSLNADGSATFVLSGTATTPASGGLVSNALCSLGFPLTLLFGCKQQSLTIQAYFFADHGIVDSTDATFGWFQRNKWHEVTYYAVHSGYAPGGTKPTCTTGSPCLSVAFHRNSTGASDSGLQHAVLLLSGRSLISGAVRPNATLADWFEGANADGTSPFEVRSQTLLINRSFNDRIAVLSSN
jgi:hypothetical protein